jgi:TonB family protein
VNLPRQIFGSGVALLFCGCCLAVAAPPAKPKSEAYKAYEGQAGMLATTAVQAQLADSFERLYGTSFDLAFQVDRQGRVHNVKVVLSKPNPAAQEIARRAVSSLKLPPFPKKLADEQRQMPVEVETTFNIGVKHTGNKLVKPDSPETQAYLVKVDAAIYGALTAEIANHRGPLKETVTITLVLDQAGHVRTEQILSTRGDSWLKEAAIRVVRTTKLPPMPKNVAAEHEGGLVAFQTQLVYDKRD